jgi:hypothetical protein
MKMAKKRKLNKMEAALLEGPPRSPYPESRTQRLKKEPQIVSKVQLT